MSETEEAPAPKKGGKMPLMIIIGVVLLLNVLLVGKVFFGGGGGGDKGAKKKAEHASEEVGDKMPLDEFLVNLGGTEHYLKLTLALGLRKDCPEDKLKDDIPPIRDAVLTVLGDKQPEQLANEAGKEQLKRELQESINKELGGQKVVKVYFMAFATQ